MARRRKRPSLDPAAGGYEVRRSDRVAGEVQRCLAEALLHHARDPRLGQVNLTRVRLTPDLKLATVYFLLLSDEEFSREEALQGLERAAPFFRKHVADTMQLRYTPAFRFFYDEELDQARRIDSLIRDTRIGPEPTADPNGEDDFDA